jgi:hypothetical protein
MSLVGPSELSKRNWKQAQGNGMKTMAKVQFNNTWECSAVPYIPVPHLVQRHIDNLKAENVTGLMLSWTLGGYPSPNLELSAQSYWDDSTSGASADPIAALAAQKFSPEVAAKVEQAWQRFGAAFPNFPFNISTLYSGPQNYGPMNQLHPAPTNIHATMLGFPYDSLYIWRSIYPDEVFQEQFRKLSKGWSEGVTILEATRDAVDEPSRAAFDDLYNVAKTVGLHFRSTYHQITFVRLRDEIIAGEEANDNNSIQPQVKRILAVIKEEIEVAKALLQIVQRDSRIGYEASNHYYYTRHDLREKVLNCEYVRGIFAAKQI